jgi:tripartite-type tricarboxylate transporter receptor subunit TctC
MRPKNSWCKGVRLQTITHAAVAAALASLAFSAAAADYPEKNVRFIVPFVPGGASDLLARTIAQKLSEKWGQPVIVDNRPGAGGNIGLGLALKAPADGYTLAMLTSHHVVNSALYKQMPFDILNDFAPITEAGAITTLLAVHPSVPAKTVKDLVALAKARPGQLNLASGTNGMTGELFKLMTGAKMTTVLYKGAVPAITDTVAGNVEVIFATVSDLAPFIRSGRLRGLATGTPRRSPKFPELPPVADTVPGYDVSVWYGVAAPARTPASIISAIHQDLTAGLRQPEVVKRLSDQDIEVTATAPRDFAARIRAEHAKWPQVVKAAGIPLN